MSSEYASPARTETSLTILRELLVRYPSSVGSSLRSTPLSSIATTSSAAFSVQSRPARLCSVRSKLVSDSGNRRRNLGFSATMLADSARQIIGHSNVEHAVMLIRDD